MTKLISNISIILIVLLLITASGPFLYWIAQGGNSAVGFIKADFNYANRRIILEPKCRSIENVAKFLNGKSKIEFYTSHTRFNKFMRYYLYPFSDDSEKSNIIKIYSGKKPKPIEGERILNIGNGVYLQSQNDLEILENHNKIIGLGKLGGLEQFASLLNGVLFWFLASLFSGKCLLNLTGQISNRFISLRWFGLEVLTGTAFLSIISWGLLIIGVGLSTVSTISFIILPILLVFIFLIIDYQKQSVSDDSIGVCKPFSCKKVLVKNTLGYFICLIVIIAGAISLCGYFSYTFLESEMTWDSYSHWLVKAKVFFQSNAISFPQIASTNKEYPVLWPILIAMQYKFAGVEMIELGRWTAGLLYLSFLHVLYSFLRRKNYERMICLFACSVFHIWFSHVSLAWGYAESLLLSLSFACCVSLLMYIEKPKNSILLIVAIFSASTCLAKYEGFISAGAILFSGFLYQVIQRKYKSSIQVLISSILSIIVIFTHFLWLSKNGEVTFTHGNNGIPKLSNMLNMLEGIISWNLHYHVGGLCFCAGALLIVILLKKSEFVIDYVATILFLPAVITILFIPFSMIFWNTSSAATLNTAAPRLLLHAYPFLYLLTIHTFLLNCSELNSEKMDA